MDDPLLFRIILSTTKGERKNFSKTMFWGDLSYRTDKEKNRLRAGMNCIFIISPITFILFFILVLFRNVHWWDLIGLSIILYGLFSVLIIPYGDYYIYEYKSQFPRKRETIREPFNHIDFYHDYMQYHGLNKSFKGFKFKERDNSFHLKFILNETSKAKAEGFFLLKYQDVENSGVDIEAFRTFLSEKANASDK